MRLRVIDKYIVGIMLILAGMLTGCREDSPAFSQEQEGQPVIFSATVKDVLVTRASEKAITNRSLNIIFSNSSGYESGTVNFNSQGLGSSIRDDNGTETDLIWEYLGYVFDENDKDKKTPLYSFYVDNVPEEFNNDTFIQFPENPDENPYKADLYRSYENEDNNDLIWGSIEKIAKANSLTISMSHLMSRVELWVYFDNTVGLEVKEPKSASISNIFQAPTGFDRITGELQLPESLPEESTFTLAGDNTEYGWREEYDATTGTTYYVSADFLVPPQQFVSNQRPRLSVTLAGDRVYSGLFPLAMNLLDENDKVTPWVMSFIRGYKIILKVKIGNEPSTLEFMPSTVLEWESKGTKNISGLQSSIAKDEDLKKLIDAYNKGDTSNFDRWGYQENGKWIFNVFLNLNVSSDLKGKMQENPELPYDFNLNRGMVMLQVDSNTTLILTQNEKGAEILKSFLSEGIVPEN